MNNKAKIIFKSLVFIVFLSFYLNISAATPYHTDEYEWIGRSYLFDMVIKHDLSNPLLNGYYSYDQPKLVYYIYGLALYPDYLTSNKRLRLGSFKDFLENMNLYQDMSSQTPTLTVLKNELSPLSKEKDDCSSPFCRSLPAIDRGRVVSIFFTVLTILIIFEIGLILGNIYYACCLATLWGSSYLVLVWNMRAMAEGIFLFFFNLGLLLILRSLVKNNTSIRESVLIGTVISLTYSTKINGLLLLIIFVSLIIYKTFVNIFSSSKFKETVHKNNMKVLFITTLVFLILTYFLNPFIWDDPFNKSVYLFKHRYKVAQEQQNLFPKSALPTIYNRVGKIYDHFLTNKERDFLRFIFLPPINQYIKQSLFIAGMINLIYLCRKDKQIRLFLISSVVIFAAVSVYLLLDWDRYYNLLLLPFLALILMGLVSVIKYIPFTRFLSKNTHSTKFGKH